MIIINFKSSTITKEIQEFEYGDSGYAMFVDANYENAEGKIGDFPVVISEPTEDGLLYYINVNALAPVSREDLSGDSGFVEFTKDGKNWIAAYQKVNWEGKFWYVLVNVPEGEITAAAMNTQSKINGLCDKTKNSLLLIIAISIVLVVVIGYLFAHSITKPISELVVAGNKIAEGEVNVELPKINTKDEVQDLSGTMDMLVGAIKFLRKDKGKKK